MAAAVPAGNSDRAARPMPCRVVDRVATDPDRIWFRDGDQETTGGELYAEASALAAAFVDLGLLPGDTISFQLPNWRESAAVNLAASICSLVINPIVPIYRDAEVEDILIDSRSRLLLVPATFRGFDYLDMAERLRGRTPALRHVVAVRGVRDGTLGYGDLVRAFRGKAVATTPLAADAVKLRLYTSGTTGRAKAVLHSQATIDRFVGTCARHWELKPGDAVLMPSPVTHITGYGFGLEMPCLVDTTTILMDRWDATMAITLITRHDVVMTVAATPFLSELVDVATSQGAHLPSLRVFGCGGAPVAPDLVHRANRQFARQPAFRVFGCSELPMISFGRGGGGDGAATSEGRPIDYEVKVVDAAGAGMPVDSEGEILARGPAMFLGYAGDTQNDAALTADGWFRTGDMGTLSTDGLLAVTGRKKDLIIRGGENISSREIEEVLLRCPAIRDAAIVAMPHDRLGESVCAVVMLWDGRTIEEVDAFVRAQRLALQKCPERYEIVASLPVTAAGKVRKDLLREMVRAHILDEAARPAGEPRAPTEKQ